MDNLNKVLADDNASKIKALDAVLALADRNDVKRASDVLDVINTYREVLSVQFKGEQYQADANADHVTEQIPNV